MPKPTPSQKEIHDIFHREGYFYCIQEKCSMRKTLCIQYQHDARGKMQKEYVKGINKTDIAAMIYKCLKCPQGKAIKQELKEKGIIK